MADHSVMRAPAAPDDNLEGPSLLRRNIGGYYRRVRRQSDFDTDGLRHTDPIIATAWLLCKGRVGDENSKIMAYFATQRRPGTLLLYCLHRCSRSYNSVLTPATGGLLALV
jgi:hypothetical protein